MALSFVAQSARGVGRPPIPQRRGRQGHLDPRALPDPLARRGRPQARQGDRRLLDLGRRARHERLDLHGARGRLHRAPTWRPRCRPASARCPGPLHGGAPSRVLTMLDEVESRGRRRALGQAGARLRRAADGLRPPRLPRRGSARPRAAPHRARDRRAAARRGRAARAGGARRAEGAQARPRAGHQRGVLVGGRARLRGGAAGAVHADVLLRARRRLGGAHPRAEARGPADPAERQVRRARARGPRTR